MVTTRRARMEMGTRRATTTRKRVVVVGQRRTALPLASALLPASRLMILSRSLIPTPVTPSPPPVANSSAQPFKSALDDIYSDTDGKTDPAAISKKKAAAKRKPALDEKDKDDAPKKKACTRHSI